MSQEKTARSSYKRYSVAFKMKVSEEVENGLITLESAGKLYGVPLSTVAEWVKKYGINARINKVVYVMTNEEERELLRLRKENSRLLKALDDSHLKNLALESLIEIAEETYDVDLKKNIGSQLAAELRKKLKQSSLEVED